MVSEGGDGRGKGWKVAVFGEARSSKLVGNGFELVVGVKRRREWDWERGMCSDCAGDFKWRASGGCRVMYGGGDRWWSVAGGVTGGQSDGVEAARGRRIMTSGWDRSLTWNLLVLAGGKLRQKCFRRTGGLRG
ncbi:hypothetical protein Tco_1302883 [Tanacetum coccineum]